MVTTPAARPAGAERFIALDSLRGIAAISVMYYHMGDFGWVAGFTPFRSGWILVDFFFILSGFVIAASYGARLAHGYPRGGFLLVRLGRLYPLHIVTVALFVALEFLVFRPVLHESHSLSELARGVFLFDAFVRGAGNFYAPVSWAVAVELVVYILAAALFGRGRWAIAVALGLAGASAWALHSGFNVIGFSRLLQRGLLGFPLGVGCFWLHRRLLRVQPGAAVLSVAECGLLAAFVGLLWMPGKSAASIPLADALYAAMVLVLARDGGIASRALQMRPLVRLGQLSFALYMVHLVFVILSNRFLPRVFAAAGHADWIRPGRNTFGLLRVAPPLWLATLITLGLTALALMAAWLAWRFIEEPTRHWTRRLGPTTAPVAPQSGTFIPAQAPVSPGP
ncbi:MAG: acyltransferase [Croceibacterium sp.]